jgi:hypothetical protein
MKKRMIVSIAGLCVAGLAGAGTADAATWTTVARASDASPYSTFAYLSKTLPGATLRAVVNAPRGRTRVTGYVFCDYGWTYATQNFGWRYRSRGFRHPWWHAIPLADASAISCDVSLDATGRGGRLRVRLQQSS